MNVVTLTPSSDVSQSANCKTTATVVFWTEVADANDATYLYAAVNTGDGAEATFEMSDMPVALLVASVTLRWRAQFGDNDGGPPQANFTRAFCEIAGVRYYTGFEIPGAFPGAFADHVHVFSVHPTSGVAWTAAQVNAARFGVEMSTSGYTYFPVLPSVQRLAVDVSYSPLPPDQEASRDAASRKLYLRRTPSQLPQITGGLWLLDLAHHTQVDLHHILGVSGSALGWEPTTWKRGMMGVSDVSVDPMTNTVTLTLRNERRIRCLLYDSGWARQGGPTKNGLMKFSNGAIWTFTRASSATFVDASGESVTVQADVEAYRDAGQEFLAAAGGRAQDRGYWSNNAAGRTYSAARNSMRFEVTPDWNAAAVTALNLTVAYIYHNANNSAWLHFDGANARWVLALRVAGTTYRATKAHSPVAGTRYVIGARVTGSHGELDLTPFTASIFVDGVKGTDVVAGAAMTEAAVSTFDIGTKAGTDPFRGCIRRRISRQIVLTDIEMARSFS